MTPIESETKVDPAVLDPRALKRRTVLVALAILVGILLMALKFYAYRLTRSSAILSDALESIINVVASSFALVSILVASRPPDDCHPYGHGKIEFFSAGFEGALIIMAAFGVFKSSIPRLMDPAPLPHLNIGLLLLTGASVINLILGLGMIRSGKHSGSLTLVADGRHLLTDVYTSAGVVLGLVLVKVTGWLWLDGLIACLVGLNILVTGFSLLRQSFHGLMDAADRRVLIQLSDLLTRNRRANWLDIHQLRAWKSGDYTHIDMHLVLPRDCSLEQAHREAKIVEAIVVEYFAGRASALIHMDPCVEDDCPACRQDGCPLRKDSPAADIDAWSLGTFTARKDARWGQTQSKK